MARSPSSVSAASAANDKMLGIGALGSFAVMLLLSGMSAIGLTGTSIPVKSAKYWTALTMSGWAFAIWGAIWAAMALFLVYGLSRALRNDPLPHFAACCRVLIPTCLLTGGWCLAFGQDYLRLGWIMIALVTLGNSLMYVKTMCSTNNAGAGPCMFGGACPAASRNTNSTSTPGRTSPKNPNGANQAGAKECTRQALGTMWIRLLAPWTFVALILFTTLVWKYTVWGHAPLSDKAAQNRSWMGSLAHTAVDAVKDKVVGGNSALSAVEGAWACTAMVGLVGVAVVMAMMCLDGVPAAVFTWACLGMACHSKTVGAAAKLAPWGLGTWFGRFGSLISNLGIGGVWSLGGKHGEGWWLVVHDVALACALANLIICIVTVAFKCRKMTGKTA